MKTFLHDPLVEWSKQAKGLSKAQANETGEIVNEKVCTFVSIFAEFWMFCLYFASESMFMCIYSSVLVQYIL